MRLLRSVVAIVAGFWFMTAAAQVGGLLAARFLLRGVADSAPLPPAYLAAALATTAIGSLMGGWLTARIAPFAPFGHACALAAVSLALMASVAIGAPAPQSPWYSIATGLVTAAGAALGGRLRAAAAAAAAGPVVA